MFIGESIWTREALAECSLTSGSETLKIDSFTHEFRTKIQPHIEQIMNELVNAKKCRLVSAKGA